MKQTKFKKYLISANLTAAAVARKTKGKVSIRAAQAIAKGKQAPTLKSANAIAAALKVSVSELF